MEFVFDSLFLTVLMPCLRISLLFGWFSVSNWERNGLAMDWTLRSIGTLGFAFVEVVWDR